MKKGGREDERVEEGRRHHPTPLARSSSCVATRQEET